MSDPRAGYAYFEVEADVGVRAWGTTLADAFAQAALGTLALAIAPEDVEDREPREVRAQGDSYEELLVAWINECLYVHEVEGFAVCRVEMTTFGPTLAHGLLRGEEIDASRHHRGTVVKAATLHQLSVSQGEGGPEVHVIVDV